jgi:hypothetical protein
MVKGLVLGDPMHCTVAFTLKLAASFIYGYHLHTEDETGSIIFSIFSSFFRFPHVNLDELHTDTASDKFYPGTNIHHNLSQISLLHSTH